MSSTWVNKFFVKFKERCRGGIRQSYKKVKLSLGSAPSSPLVIEVMFIFPGPFWMFKLMFRLNTLQTVTSCTPKFWSEKVSTTIALLICNYYQYLISSFPSYFTFFVSWCEPAPLGSHKHVTRLCNLSSPLYLVSPALPLPSLVGFFSYRC
jgi:hypothetical protein